MEVTELLVAVVALFAIFGLVPLIIFFLVREHIRMKNRVRMAEIEKGIAAPAKAEPSANDWTRKSATYVGIGLGFIFGYLFDRFAYVDNLVAYGSMIFLFLGLSRLVYHYKLKK